MNGLCGKADEYTNISFGDETSSSCIIFNVEGTCEINFGYGEGAGPSTSFVGKCRHNLFLLFVFVKNTSFALIYGAFNEILSFGNPELKS
jgi:hypothetical protein